jgi:hypothetical protein
MRLSTLALLSLLAALTACAGMNAIESDVSTYSQWPADRKATSYAFERLPSQQARPQEQAQLEATARPALAQAGFVEAADPKDADVTVQVGVRISRTDRYYDDPFWWRGGSPFYSRWGARPFWGPGAGLAYDSPRYDREVAVLIRDRKTNQPLYEARASNDGLTSGGDQLTGAMFIAAMKDFPHNGINPRRITVPLPG